MNEFCLLKEKKMSEKRFRIAADHQIDKNRIASLILSAISNSDLKLGDKREPVMKNINELVKDQIKKWSGGEVSLVDFKMAAKTIIKDLIKELAKDEILIEESEEELLTDIIRDTFETYIEAGEIKTTIKPSELKFSSEEDAIQYLADISGKKIVIKS